MPIRIVRLGSRRVPREGLRIGTVRRPPRGVPKSDYASRDLYDVWFPTLAPSETLLKQGLTVKDERDWKRFERAYRREMQAPDAKRALDLLAAMSHQSNFSVGCYSEKKMRCHRSILRDLLAERGADVKA